jgi:threonine dehydratase
VAAAGAPAMQRSLAAGHLVETERVDTVDGLAVRSPAPQALTMLKGCYDAAVAISDADVIRAMAVAADRLGLVLEPLDSCLASDGCPCREVVEWRPGEPVPIVRCLYRTANGGL